jgi:endonuclease-3
VHSARRGVLPGCKSNKPFRGHLLGTASVVPFFYYNTSMPYRPPPPRVLAERKARAKKILRELKKLFPDAGMMLNYRNNWELLVAVELSAQCTDKMVNRVTETLFKKYRTLDDYVRAKPRAFERDIYRTGFYRAKTKNILAAAKLMKTKFRGKMPKTMEEMLSIPGVARKTANIVLGNAHGIVEGIAVDTHVKRLALKLGLSMHENTDWIERDLMAILPRDEWFTFTYRLIEYGRKYCPARPHAHDKCPLTRVVKR